MSNVKINLTHEEICKILTKHFRDSYKLEVPSKFEREGHTYKGSFNFSLDIEDRVYSNLDGLSVEVTAKI